MNVRRNISEFRLDRYSKVTGNIGGVSEMYVAAYGEATNLSREKQRLRNGLKMAERAFAEFSSIAFDRIGIGDEAVGRRQRKLGSMEVTGSDESIIPGAV